MQEKELTTAVMDVNRELNRYGVNIGSNSRIAYSLQTR